MANGSTLRTYSTAADGGTTLTATNNSTLVEGPREMALTPDGQTLLLGNFLSRTLQVISLRP